MHILVHGLLHQGCIGCAPESLQIHNAVPTALSASEAPINGGMECLPDFL